MSSTAEKLKSEAPAPTVDALWQAFQRAPLGASETDEQKRMSADALRGPFPSSAVVSAEIAARCPPGKSLGGSRRRPRC